jgi:prefoldin subunit 5
MAKFDNARITDQEKQAKLIQNLADRPNAMSSYGRAKMSAEDVKKAFDDQFILVVDKHNVLLGITEDTLKDEDTRKESEMLREEAEDLRSDAERDRAENEYGNPEYKFDPEQGCVVNGDGEQVPDSDIGGRVGAEMIRQTAEGLRSDAESERAASESERAKNEYGDPEYKYDPEQGCVVNGDGEQVPDSELGGRVGAEKKRENTFGTLDKALEEIEETQNRLIEGVFSEQYLTDLDEVNAQLNDIEALLKDPIAEDNYDESIGGIRTRVAANEKNISQAQKSIGEIGNSVNAIAQKTNGLEIYIGNNANSISTLSPVVQTNSQAIRELDTDVKGLDTSVKNMNSHMQEYDDRLDNIDDYLAFNQGDKDNVFLRCYPVGSIYMSVNPTDPAYLFGGSWVALKDRFLVGAGGSYSVTAEGGEARHTLTLEEMPLHSHIQQATSNYDGWARKQVQAVGSTSGSIQDVTNVATNGTQYSAGNYASPVYTQQNGGGQPHNNIPPYYAVYMWRREK